MKITPLEIRQKTFEKNFRGFDKDEVSSFLVSLSQEWEREMDEKRELQVKLEQVQKESAKLREVEDSLFKTLKAAEDTGANMIEQANKTAELILKEAQMNADAMIAESKNKSRSIIEEAESRSKRIMEDLKADVSALVESYEELLAQREIVIRNLKNMASDSLENVKQSQEDIKRIDLDVHTKAVKELSRKSPHFNEEDAPKQSPKEKSHTFVIEPRKEKEQAPVAPEVEKEQPSPSHEIKEDPHAPKANEDTEAKQPEKDAPKVDERAPEEAKKEEEPQAEKKKASGSFFDQFD
ncbi:DivIVA domain-containing protein [Echinicola vietnamensis]|uniref:DivIVA domain protein n=1 Tax=Echinicola vietnamensis (strain DSM 17526 / LMG 23754 / KMM 6221) TaxID=926556 RepID=L0FUP8_ECHVK|nr:DivIVA domain-containing protein [Echinicola vietnamensis]AGA76405.1 DivIVA domain protein [Echinicola vietnamensis DSM 17526]